MRRVQHDGRFSKIIHEHISDKYMQRCSRRLQSNEAAKLGIRFIKLRIICTLKPLPMKL
jgi:hypothetical protein